MERRASHDLRPRSIQRHHRQSIDDSRAVRTGNEPARDGCRSGRGCWRRLCRSQSLQRRLHRARVTDRFEHAPRRRLRRCAAAGAACRGDEPFDGACSDDRQTCDGGVAFDSVRRAEVGNQGRDLSGGRSPDGHGL